MESAELRLARDWGLKMDLLTKDWDRTPYVYVIGWQWLGLYYIGCQYGKGCHPDNLIVQYRTSSKRVHEVLDQHGDPDIAWYRIVNTIVEAQNLEGFLINISNAINNKKYLNIGGWGQNGHIRTSSDDERLRREHSKKMTGRKHTEEQKQKIRIGNLGKTVTAESKERMSRVQKKMVSFEC